MIGNLITDQRRPAVKKRLITLIRMTAVNVLAVASFGYLVWAHGNAVGLALALAFLVMLVFDFFAGVLGTTLPVRVLVLSGLLVAWEPPGNETSWVAALVGCAVLLLVLSERMRSLITVGKRLRVEHLPGYQIRGLQLVEETHLGAASIGLILLAWLATCFSWPTWPMLIAAVVVAVVYLVALLQLVPQVLGSRGPADLTDVLTSYAPRFLVHWSAPANSEFQIFMWLPYLDRIGVPYAVVLREQHSFDKVAARANAPVILAPTILDLDTVMVPSLHAVFYVNNGMKNTHSVRFSDLTHIQLLHGDSDKAPSYNPVTGMFDQVFVAGEAAIDRYEANGVEIPRSRFTIVGRPQVEDVAVVESAPPPGAPWTVLYAPTWRGYTRDANYSSLPMGTQIITGLLGRGATILVRAHPYTGRDTGLARNLSEIHDLLEADREATGREHLWGDPVTTERTLFDCFNMSDALISDVSSVVSDYLFSAKPFAITDMLGEGESFTTSFPLARAGYVLQVGAEPWLGPLDAMFSEDPLRAVRRELRTYYLGDFGPEHYADHFVAAARGFVEGED